MCWSSVDINSNTSRSSSTGTFTQQEDLLLSSGTVISGVVQQESGHKMVSMVGTITRTGNDTVVICNSGVSIIVWFNYFNFKQVPQLEQEQRLMILIKIFT